MAKKGSRSSFHMIVLLFASITASEFVPFQNSSNGCVDTVVSYSFKQNGKGYSQAQCTGRAGECCRLGPNCYDCSGLVYMAYKQAGITAPITTYGYPGNFKAVGLANAQPGDVLWNTGHVGIVGYNNQVIHAANPTRGIYIMTLANFKTYCAPTQAFRACNDSPSPSTKLWRVQSGAFSVKSNAENLMARIKASGLEAFIVLHNNLYKVQCGAFSSQANAQARLNTLKSKGFEGALVYY
ncbi:hypothetical protein BLNAU_2289 [Blattamonas nauphoetae]|uniref:SPOR domain-containing protein n=1 Tax=Blattamonas nauphoetae TaxID=2049346 RepID=A0ABQ9YGZ8_9EUKA|nr:hypothetical protein BLNAU_2289 [Blattamonas nauphoetae]